MKACFAFDKMTSPLANVMVMPVQRYPAAQYMALCQFNTVYLDFDSTKNYEPHVVFEGKIERLDAIDVKFPHNIDTVYFSEVKGQPAVRFVYDFTEAQLAKLAKKGMWSVDGIHFGEVLTSAKFQLEVFASVEEIMLDDKSKLTTEEFISRACEVFGDEYSYAKTVYRDYQSKVIITCRQHGDFERTPSLHLQGFGCPLCEKRMPPHRTCAPVFNINMINQYENKFDETAYDILDFISREQQDEKQAIENGRTFETAPEDNIAAQVEAAKAAAREQAAAEQAASYKPMTEEEMIVRRQSVNVSDYVNSVMQNLQDNRDAGNAIVAAEEARIAAEKAEAEKAKNNEPEVDPNKVEFKEDDKSKKTDDISKLVEVDNTTKYESNEAIFNAQSESSEDKTLTGKAAEFMAMLAGSDAAETEAEPVKTENKNDDSSGAASGAQGLGVYTFEDQSTAHYEMRADEGKGNEKPVDSDNADSGSGSDNSSNSDSGAASGAQGLGVYTFEDQSTAQHAMRADEGKGNEKPADEKAEEKKTEEKKSEEKKSKTEKEKKESADKASDTKVEQMNTVVNTNIVSGADGSKDKSDMSK